MRYGDDPTMDRAIAREHAGCTTGDCAWRALWDRMQFEERMRTIARQLPGGLDED